MAIIVAFCYNLEGCFLTFLLLAIE